MDFILLQIFIFLAAAAIAVPISKRLGLGSVLGYLIAGIFIGPYGLDLVGNVESLLHFTEFGVVMMLFLVGLELKPSLLWKMRTPIFATGSFQVIITTLVIFLIARLFLPWQQALAIGLILSLSSTAIVLQTLKEKGLSNTKCGRSIFSVLLFQDLAVIPMLALLPLLTNLDSYTVLVTSEPVLFNVNLLPGYIRLIFSFLAIFSIFFIGKFASRPIFRIIAATHIREIFVAAALALIVGIALLMEIVGLSAALGAFLAGVVLADSEYRHELESDIEPFKGLLLGIFFMSIGANINFNLISKQFLLIILLSISLIFIKAIILLLTGVIFKFEKKVLSLFTVTLAQGGEFAFVLLQLSKTSGILPDSIIDPLVSSVVISMFLTPLFFRIHEKITSKQKAVVDDQSFDDKINHNNHKVIIAGFGRAGTDIGRFLISAGIKPTIIDNDALNVSVLRKFGFEIYYGDITRLDLLKAAGAETAELLIITIHNIDIARKLIDLSKKHYPHLEIIVNAYNLHTQYELMDIGVKACRRETFGSSLDLGVDALKIMGYEPYKAHQLMLIFKKNDEEITPELYKKSRENEESYISFYQENLINLEEIMLENQKVNLKSSNDKFHQENDTDINIK